MHVCHRKNVFDLQFHIEGAQVCDSQGQASEPSRVRGELIIFGKVLLMEESGEDLLHVTHTGQYGPMTQPTDLSEVEPVAAVQVGHMLEVVMKAAEDGILTIITNVNKIRRLGGSWWMTQCILWMG